MNKKRKMEDITINDIFGASKMQANKSSPQCAYPYSVPHTYNPFNPVQMDYMQSIYNPFIPQSYQLPILNNCDSILKDAGNNINAYNDIIDQIGKLDEFIESFDDTINYIDQEISLLEGSKDQFINDLDLAKDKFLEEIEQEKNKYISEIDNKCNTLKTCKDKLTKMINDKRHK